MELDMKKPSKSVKPKAEPTGSRGKPEYPMRGDKNVRSKVNASESVKGQPDGGRGSDPKGKARIGIPFKPMGKAGKRSKLDKDALI